MVACLLGNLHHSVSGVDRLLQDGSFGSSMSGMTCLCCQYALGARRMYASASTWYSGPRVFSSICKQRTRLQGHKFGGCLLGERKTFLTNCSAREEVALDDSIKEGSSNQGGEVSGVSFGTTDIVEGMGKLLQGEPQVAAQAAGILVTSIDRQGRAALLSALFSSGADSESDVHFNEADTNSDGVVDRVEFAAYVEAQAVKHGTSAKPLSAEQLYQLGLRAGIGMIGFGFTDNAIMIIAGDAIQNSIGGVLGLTPLLSAGLGNAIADLVGTAFRGYIERMSNQFMPEIRISAIQMTYKEAWWADTVGSSLGVTLGCLLGLVPLLIIRPGGGPVPEDAVASASGVSSASKDVVWCSEKQVVESSAGDTGKTFFASVSSSPPPLSLTPHHAGRLSHSLGGPVLMVMISVFMALRRLRERSHSRRRQVPKFR